MSRLSVKSAAWITVFFLMASCSSWNTEKYVKDQNTYVKQLDTSCREAVEKFSLGFNSYRKKYELPVLRDSFVFTGCGVDFVIWRNPDPKPPCLEEKNICYLSPGPALLWETNVFVGPENEALRFRYARKNSDSFAINYGKLDESFKKEEDSLFLRGYLYYYPNGTRKSLNRQQFDSVLEKWGLLIR